MSGSASKLQPDSKIQSDSTSERIPAAATLSEQLMPGLLPSFCTRRDSRLQANAELCIISIPVLRDYPEISHSEA